MNYTNSQLKAALAKMLPEHLAFVNHNQSLCRIIACSFGDEVKDTELLHLCWMVEETLITRDEQNDYIDGIYRQEPYVWWNHPDCHASWQQRVIALCKVKGVEIV